MTRTTARRKRCLRGIFVSSSFISLIDIYTHVHDLMHVRELSIFAFSFNATCVDCDHSFESLKKKNIDIQFESFSFYFSPPTLEVSLVMSIIPERQLPVFIVYPRSQKCFNTCILLTKTSKMPENSPVGLQCM